MAKSRAEKLALIALGQNGLKSQKTKALTSTGSFLEAASQVASSSNVFYQSTEPLPADSPNGELLVGDLWMNTAMNYKIHVWDGSVWEAVPVEGSIQEINGSLLVPGTVVADDVVSGYVYTGELNADNITTGTLDAIDINGSTITGSAAVFDAQTISVADWTGHSWAMAAINTTDGPLTDGGSVHIGLAYGAVGEAKTTGGFGVYGLSNTTNGKGVVGETSVSNGIGIYGNNKSTGYGGFFTNKGGDGNYAHYVEQNGAATSNYIARVNGSFSVYSTVYASVVYAANNMYADYFEAGIGDGGGIGDAYGLSTGNYKAYIGGGVEPFTGVHVCISKEINKPTVGDIATVYDAYGHNVSQSYFYVRPTDSAMDKTIVGVYTDRVQDLLEFATWSNDFGEKVDGDDLVNEENDIEGVDIEGRTRQLKAEYKEYIESLYAEGYYAVSVNSVGEGMLNVCDENGNIEAGDYLCSSNVPGKGMKQTDDLLHNYTVAKAMEDVVWDNEAVGETCQEIDGVKWKQIACTYHCG
jgi:hypothetical protein